jgi:hypothetical protein
MDYFSRKSLSKYLMNTKMACGKNMRATYGDSSKLHGSLNFAFDQREMEVNLHKVAFSTSNMSPASRPF